MSSSMFNSILALGRFKMTVFSAVTYAAGATFALQLHEGMNFNGWTFTVGYFFVLFCQLVAHYTGEYYDFDSDALNVHSTPLTGGSKVLVGGLVNMKTCLLCAYVSAMSSFACLFLLLMRTSKGDTLMGPHNTGILVLGIAMLCIAHQYCSPPFKLNHCGLGEAGAAIVMNVLLPWFSALLLDSENVGQYLNPYVAMKNLAPLIIPAWFLKFALFLVLNMEDRRPDWQSGKNTLPVKLGEDVSAKLASLFIFIGYFCAVWLYIIGHCKATTLASILVSAPTGVGIALSLLKPLPYRLDGIVLRCLKHAPMVVLGVFFDSLVRELFSKGATGSMALRCVPVLPFLILFAPKRNKPKHNLTHNSNASDSNPILIVGAGIGGLTMSAALNCLGIRSIVYEKYDGEAGEKGADLALWPSAACMLEAIGVGKGTDFWKNDLYPLDTVYMTRICKNGSEEVLKKVNMAQVCSGTSRKFSLVSREKLMAVMKAVVPSSSLAKGKVTSVEEDVNSAKLYLSKGDGIESKLVVGADGIRSVCRKYVIHGRTNDEIRQGGEICYRGVIHLKDGDGIAVKKVFEENEKMKPKSMSVVYGNNLRYSWGYIDSSHDTGYWFVKQLIGRDGPANDPHKHWPEPLASFAKFNPEGIYQHSIQDRPPIPKWSSKRVVLIGDACHAVTPNNGQGACMAIEDAFVLAILLRRYWNEPDGYVEAMYQYERARRSHTKKIYAESFKQMKIGQLASPLGVWFRNFLLRNLPSSVLEKKLRAVNVFESELWIKEFEALRLKQK